MTLNDAIRRTRELADTISDAAGQVATTHHSTAVVYVRMADAEALEMILAGLEEPPPLVPDGPEGNEKSP